MINSVTKGRMDDYLQKMMTKALQKDQSNASSGEIDLKSEFKTLLDDNDKYPISKYIDD